MAERLFVYGTLGPEGPNRRVLAELGGEWIPASVRGYLREEGWGAASGYPGIVLDDDAAPVEGHVFVSENLAAHWDDLDAFEGDDYDRVTATARLADGTTVDAFVYVLRRPP